MALRTALRPGVICPELPVPKAIERPEYVGKSTVAEGSEPWVQTPEVIEKMRIAGRIAAGALAEAGKAVAPGVTTDELDRIAHDYMVDHGAYPSTLHYKGFPKSCCTSLNEIICHGIPDSTVIEDGDIVNIDVTAYIDGVPARRAHPRGDDARHQSGQARPGALGRRPGHRGVRKQIRLQRRS
jgi:methionyl aminopeptidase